MDRIILSLYKELVQVYKEKGNDDSCLIKVLLNQLPNLDENLMRKYTVHDFMKNLEQINNTWELFCERYPNINSEYFLWYVLSKLKIINLEIR